MKLGFAADDPAASPAAFRRLCVETCPIRAGWLLGGPAAFRRLCVETHMVVFAVFAAFPAAFRRLCVETKTLKTLPLAWATQPPSGGCVLKQ